jgi:hypothetical protein
MELHRFVWGQSPREICNSVIMKAKLTHFLIFHPCQETYLGQVGVWEARKPILDPVLHTRLWQIVSVDAHTHMDTERLS